jgi:hypothetical protein
MNQPKKPLKKITQSGKYQLKLIAPTIDKIKKYDQNYAASIWFVDAEGNNLNKMYGTKYAPTLATLIGKFTGKYVPAIKETASAEQLLAYIEQANMCIAEIDIEVIPPKAGSAYPTFKFKSITPIIGNGNAGSNGQGPDDDEPSAPAVVEPLPF